eukprot:TRINITY_DN52379_c0_g1_i1.p1 TRINITY_DN52379_c0_g1~~TRINITY_DN52379_c0_g1_i1.p1  ORF type:complete len:290 (-),score=43.62 TRINITY_DN52379_c0_g1_i1:26-895(-)
MVSPMACRGFSICLSLLCSVLICEASFNCPKDYCLRRVSEGKTAQSFDCYYETQEAWTQCAMEGASCACDGTVKYGVYEGPLWADAQREVNDSIVCNSDSFAGEDPASGKMKFCLCRPRGTVVDPTAADTAAASSEGIEPACAALLVRIKVPAFALKLGLTEGVVREIAGGMAAIILEESSYRIVSVELGTLTNVTFMVSKPATVTFADFFANVDYIQRNKQQEMKEVMKEGLADQPQEVRAAADFVEFVAPFPEDPVEATPEPEGPISLSVGKVASVVLWVMVLQLVR